MAGSISNYGLLNESYKPYPAWKSFGLTAGTALLPLILSQLSPPLGAASAFAMPYISGKLAHRGNWRPESLEAISTGSLLGMVAAPNVRKINRAFNSAWTSGKNVYDPPMPAQAEAAYFGAQQLNPSDVSKIKQFQLDPHVLDGVLGTIGNIEQYPKYVAKGGPGLKGPNIFGAFQKDLEAILAGVHPYEGSSESAYDMKTFQPALDKRFHDLRDKFKAVKVDPNKFPGRGSGVYVNQYMDAGDLLKRYLTSDDPSNISRIGSLNQKWETVNAGGLPGEAALHSYLKHLAKDYGNITEEFASSLPAFLQQNRRGVDFKTVSTGDLSPENLARLREKVDHKYRKFLNPKKGGGRWSWLLGPAVY